MRGLIALVAALLLGAVSLAPVAAQDATPSTGGMLSGAELGLEELSIRLTDTAYEGVPAEVTTGRYLYTFENASSAPGGLNFMQLPEGMTAEDLAAMGMEPEASPAAEEHMHATPAEEAQGEEGGEEGGGIPDWFYEVAIAGGAFIEPGQTAQGIVEFTVAGNWVAWGEDPTVPQPPVGFTVTEGMASPEPGPEPAASVTVYEENTPDGFVFRFEGTFTPGQQLVKIVNNSDQPHFVDWTLSPVPITLEELQQIFGAFETGTPAAGLPSPEELVSVAFAGTQSRGTTQWLLIDLQPGTYIVACFIPDPGRDFVPHAFEGMVEIVTVGESEMPGATPEA
ncbi:MAG TPA: hypothetical protein VIL01_04740 [Thermomicrobiales bacterium]